MTKYRIIGKSQQIKKVIEMAEEVSHSNIPVLITGEIGSGKELVARNIHHNSINNRNPFVAVHCAAMPGKFLEYSIFECNGTIFLDEIGDLEPSLQSKLLRVLQEREFEPGEDYDKKRSEFKLISVTSLDLENETKAGKFRKDLLNMIKGFQIDVPPLRRRKEDIPSFVKYFLKKICAREKKTLIISDEVMEIFMNYSWPGNVRHLKNVIERAAVLTRGKTITIKDLPEEITTMKVQPDSFHREILKELEMQAIKDILQKCGGNRSRAAKVLGISRRALYKSLKEHKLI
jgi:two-component system response regulator HydG